MTDCNFDIFLQLPKYIKHVQLMTLTEARIRPKQRSRKAAEHPAIDKKIISDIQKLIQIS
jgi:hypothetical protein